MRASFGTDGIRGKANEKLTSEMAYRLGQFIGNYYSTDSKAKIIIGKDTRLSCDMLEMALAAGITATGGNVYLLGVCSTPSLIYTVQNRHFDCGLMISASHNPYTDNGIKAINGSGTKMSPEVEKQIEEYIYSEEHLPFAKAERIGSVIEYSKELDVYLEHLYHIFQDVDLLGYRIGLDCANGSATVTAEKLFKRLNAETFVINNEPTGLNINLNCGSTHPEHLAQFVRENGLDIGFAFDGDADRVIAVASDGQIIDGDKILYCAGCYLKKKGLLRNNTIATTVMSNLGLFRKLQENDIKYTKTAVGDKYVYQAMCENDYVIGGEQSGHIIFKDYATTGDGLLTALMMMRIISKEDKTLNQLTDELIVFPQLLVNVAVNDKEKAMQDVDVQNECKAVEEELKGMGRVLVRASGTESLIRVMAEADTDENCQKYVQRVVELVESKHF